MSTRATYLFEKQWTGNPCFYIHYDGYPEGAALYLIAAIEFESEYPGLAERFLRANDRAEFTSGHNTHSDTEYRYTIHDDQDISVWNTCFDYDEWKLIEKVSLKTFIKMYTDIDIVQDLNPITNLPSGRWRTYEDHLAYVEEKRDALSLYKQKFPERTENISSMKAEIERLQAILP